VSKDVFSVMNEMIESRHFGKPPKYIHVKIQIKDSRSQHGNWREGYTSLWSFSPHT